MDFKIVATSIEEFKDIQDRVKNIPEEIKSQFTVLEIGLSGLMCRFSSPLRDPSKLVILENPKFIQIRSENIYVIYEDYVFDINRKSLNSEYTFNFVKLD
jgi:hypothetical protein